MRQPWPAEAVGAANPTIDPFTRSSGDPTACITAYCAGSKVSRMHFAVRNLLGVVTALMVMSGHALELAYEPVALGWSHEEVQRATSGNLVAIRQRAQLADELGCSHHCERLERIFNRLVAVARTQTARSKTLPWILTVVRLNDIEALAMPDGHVIVSEAFIDRRLSSDESLAFVLAHEMAHSILEHERQALTYARLLLPRDVHRTVRDMYAEIDFNFALLQAMEPVMQQGELEADELGLLLASLAGYSPERQLAFVEAEAANEAARTPLISTHPNAQLRLARLRASIPLARRLAAIAVG